MPLLSANNISKAYLGDEGKIQVLENINFSLEQGGIHALVGQSGCGKSTFLLICGGLIYPDSGELVIDSKNLLSMNNSKRAQMRADLIGYVFQQFHLIPYLTIEQNILASSLVTNKKDAKKRTGELIEKLGLAHRTKHIPGKLSSGEQQRVALCRALLNNPKILIADEPTGNLDGNNGKIVLEVLREYANNGGLVLMATHDIAVASLADATYKVCKNSIAEFKI